MLDFRLDVECYVGLVLEAHVSSFFFFFFQSQRWSGPGHLSHIQEIDL